MTDSLDKSPLTTHVLDTAWGKPAVDVLVVLQRQTDNGFVQIGAGQTNADGRVFDLIKHQLFEAGVYQLCFDVGDYFKQTNRDCFYPKVYILFEVKNTSEHYHVPLLISPYGYSTYRGS